MLCNHTLQPHVPHETSRLVLAGIAAGCVHTLAEEVVKIRRPPVFTGFIRNVAFAALVSMLGTSEVEGVRC